MAKKLFVPAPPQRWQQGAAVGGNNSTIGAYFFGYYEAGNILADAALSRTGVADQLFYPICYSYRHYVELSLKYLVEETEKLAGILDELGDLKGKMIQSAGPELLKNHSLERLLRLLEERLALVSDEPLPPEIRPLIILFHSMDPDGQSFRYPTRTSGSPAFPAPTQYDLESIKSGMVQVRRCFLGIDGWLDHTRALAGDYLQTLQDEMGAWSVGSDEAGEY